MTTLDDRWEWRKDALFPLVICLSLTLAIVFYGTGPSGAMDLLFNHAGWFVAIWYFALFASNAATFVGVLLRRAGKPSYIFWEYPGSISTAIFIFLYSLALASGSDPGGSMLAIGISFLLGLHYLINFLKIQTSVFGSFKKHNKR